MDVEKDLLALEEGLWRANREGDGAFYDRVLRDDALVVSRYGVAGKADIVRIISENQNPFTRTDLSGQRVIPLTDASALITYRVDYTALVGGGTST